MSDIAIRVESLSKRYLINHQRPSGSGLRHVLQEKLTAPFRWMRHAGASKSPGDAGNSQSATEEFWALKDVSFDIQQGEVVGVIGRNGAGKSTLLKILSRITEPTSGRLTINGRMASLLEVGTGFHPDLTGRENIFLNGAILGMSRAEIKSKFDEIVAFAEVERFLDTPVKRYSSGMYVRLAFAVAAHLDPEIMVVDEVLAVGDAGFQKKCLGKMQDASVKEGRTVLFVSHNMPAIEALCRKVILMESGRVAAIGESSTLIQTFLSRMVEASQERLESGHTSNIRRVIVRNSAGLETERFSIDETITFEIDLYSADFLDRPRVGIGIHSPNGERLLTLHTDVQQNDRWDFQGTRRIIAVWRNNRLVPARYRVDIVFWGFSSEIESLPGAKYVEIVPRDVYGTGALPDPSYQGYVLPDVTWEVNATSVGHELAREPEVRAADAKPVADLEPTHRAPLASAASPVR